jgi:hypothetical protein
LGIIVLIALSVGLFLLRQGQVDYVDESTPAGVAQNYILALQRRDYQRAYGYLAEMDSKPDSLAFQESFYGYQETTIGRVAVEIGETTQGEDPETAEVWLAMLHQGDSGLFQNYYRETGYARLVRQSGAWRITSFPYPFWSYNWDIP